MLQQVGAKICFPLQCVYIQIYIKRLCIVYSCELQKRSQLLAVQSGAYLHFAALCVNIYIWWNIHKKG